MMKRMQIEAMSLNAPVDLAAPALGHALRHLAISLYGKTAQGSKGGGAG